MSSAALMVISGEFRLYSRGYAAGGESLAKTLRIIGLRELCPPAQARHIMTIHVSE